MHTQENENGMSVPTVPSTCKGFAPSLNSASRSRRRRGDGCAGLRADCNRDYCNMKLTWLYSHSTGFPVHEVSDKCEVLSPKNA